MLATAALAVVSVTAAAARTVDPARNADPNASLQPPATMPPPPGNQAPVNTSPPTISGTAAVGQTLTASPGKWSGASPMTFAYQWQRCNPSGSGCRPILGATSTTHTAQSLDAGLTLRVYVTARNSKGSSTAQSAATAIVGTGALAPSNTSPPTITGTVQVGQALTSTNGNWSGTQPIAYSSQWQRCSASGSNCSAIGGASGPTYTIQSADAGFTLGVAVTATNAVGSATARSAVTAQVPQPQQGCTGIVVTPQTNLQAVVNSNPTGTTFCLQPGTYSLSAPVETPSYDSFIGTAGVVMDGGGVAAHALHGYGGSSGQTNVTVEYITFQHFTDAAVALGWYAYVGHNEMADNQVGVSINSYSTLDDNYIHDNYQYGVVGGPGSSIVIENNEVARNNTSDYCGGACTGNAGGSKIVGSTAGTYGLTWKKNYVHDNIGNGIWSDGNVHDAVYDGNTVTANTGVGIFHEISWNAVISNNVLTDNDAEDVGLSCWHGAQIFVNTSSNVEITGNTLKANNGANDICAVSADRSETAPYPLAVANLNVHDNTAYMTGSASSGLVVTSTPSKAALAVNNQYTHNKYYVSKQSNGYWEWSSGSQLTWLGWQAQQQDRTGSLATWTG